MLQPYQSLSYSDFSDPERAADYRRALEQVGAQLGTHAPLVIGGKEVSTNGTIRSVDPSRPLRLIGTASSATGEHAAQAV